MFTHDRIKRLAEESKQSGLVLQVAGYGSVNQDPSHDEALSCSRTICS